MKKLTLILLIPLLLKSQDRILGLKWNLTPEQDLTFDFYRGLSASWISAEIANHYTKRPFLSGLIGITIGTAQSFLDRGKQGRIISCIGSATGIVFCYPIRLDYGRQKREKLEKKLNENKELLN